MVNFAFYINRPLLPLSFSHYKSMAANDPRGVVNVDPRDMIARIYTGDHYIMLHTKYISCGPHSFRRRFLSFSHIKSI